jgi:hypothetical protein
MEDDTEFYGPVKLTNQELDNLEWARNFMKMFEDKEGQRAETNRNRQQKYF